MTKARTITVNLTDQEHAAAVSRVEALNAKLAAQCGGEVPANRRIGIGDYIRTCVRADLIEQHRRAESEAAVRRAREGTGDAARA